MDIVERLKADNPNDYREHHAEMLAWTGSAFLAGERVEDEGACKGELYSFLCRTLGYLIAAEVTACNGHEAAATIESLQAEVERLEAALEAIATGKPKGVPHKWILTLEETKQLARQALAAKGETHG